MTANSSVEFLIWLLIAASVIAVIAKRIGIPYTVALVLGGLLLSVVRIACASLACRQKRRTIRLRPSPSNATPNPLRTVFLSAGKNRARESEAVPRAGFGSSPGVHASPAKY